MLVSAVQQSESAIHIHTSPYLLPVVSPSHPPYPTPLGGHKAPSWSPSLTGCIIKSLNDLASWTTSLTLNDFISLKTPWASKCLSRIRLFSALWTWVLLMCSDWLPGLWTLVCPNSYVSHPTSALISWLDFWPALTSMHQRVDTLHSFWGSSS